MRQFGSLAMFRYAQSIIVYTLIGGGGERGVQALVYLFVGVPTLPCVAFKTYHSLHNTLGV